MKKNFLKTIIIVIFMSMILTGCSEKKVADRLINESMNAIENMEYDKALELLENARIQQIKENKSVDENINILMQIIGDYKKAVKYYNVNEYERAKEIIDNINEKYIDYKIKDDIDYLKDLIESKLKTQ